MHKNLVKIGHAVPDMLAVRQTDAQTDKRVHHNTPLAHLSGVTSGRISGGSVSLKE